MSENEKFEQSELDAELEAEVAETLAPAKAETEDKPKKSKSDDKKGKDDKKEKKPSIFARIGKWFKEMKSELKKVQWPTWKTVLKNTGIVIACVLVVGVFIWVFDWLAHAIISALLNLFGKG